MNGVELGQRLRAQRVAAGRTIASVAVDAGLSVPYIANLENGRGNPTLSALRRLAEALGVDLEITLTSGEPEAVTGPSVELSAAVVRFSRTTRFRFEVGVVATRTGIDEAEVRSRLLGVFGAAEAAAARELSVIECNRLLDAMVLTLRESHP
ncbi:helix-turn-helix domain-containing protein [Umezawaea sp. Da 62-37]|uniref:helix-turn-helix domain-containing protein n=1 Tax=Umezawaea sp. Da 62-37 TaxID=3075927 RepID=UPI0028F71847|nr:helix-turn-helix domain-containing protein [Umezawaea sp. Da 62-37]WNV85556.1 helix-turn-helix domain-containing protein [Umezawaea sp. Da 62-37]